MSDPGIERRFRSVTEGPQPEAPRSLRRFLQELPESPERARRERGPFSFGFLRARPVRGVALGAMATFAVVVALVATGLTLSIRNQLGAGSSTAVPTASPASPTPRPTLPPTFRVAGLNWYGTTTAGSEPLPTSAVQDPDGGFLGVAAADNRSLLVSSPDGLRWTDVTSRLGDPGVTLHAIARGGGTYVLVGGADGTNGTDPVVYVSTDSVDWTRVATSPGLDGAPIRQVVYGSAGFVALGWNDRDGSQPVHLWWSRDGRTWEAEPDSSKLVLGDGRATLALTETEYLLSGTVGAAAAADGPEHVSAFASLDGRLWQHAYEASDTEMASPGAATAGSLRAAAGIPGTAYTLAVFGTKSGAGQAPLMKSREGIAWMAVDSFVDGQPAPAFDRLVRVGGTLLATTGDGADIYFLDTEATDAANATARPAGSPPVRSVLIWQRVRVNAVTPGPRGAVAVQAGDGAIVYGTPAEPTGIWVALP